MALNRQRTFYSDILSHLWCEIIAVGSVSMECQHGIMHFSHEEANLMEPGEYEGYCKNEKEEPDKFMGHFDDIRGGELGGKTFVEVCPKCQEDLLKYATFLFENARPVSGFLKRVAEDIEREAKGVKSNLKGCIQKFGGV